MCEVVCRLVIDYLSCDRLMTDTFDSTFLDGHPMDMVVTCLGTSLPEVHLHALRTPESWGVLPAEDARSEA